MALYPCPHHMFCILHLHITLSPPSTTAVCHCLTVSSFFLPCSNDTISQEPLAQLLPGSARASEREARVKLTSQLHQAMCEFYPPSLCAHALCCTNNDLNAAAKLLLDKGEALRCADCLSVLVFCRPICVQFYVVLQSSVPVSHCSGMLPRRL